MVKYAILGTSRPLSVSATSTIAMLTATALAGVVQGSNPYDYLIPAATLAFLVGLFLLLAGILRLGFLANLISQPVLVAALGLIKINEFEQRIRADPPDPVYGFYLGAGSFPRRDDSGNAAGDHGSSSALCPCTALPGRSPACVCAGAEAGHGFLPTAGGPARR